MAQPPPPCLICLDGSSPLGDTIVNGSIFGNNVNCETLASDAQNMDGNTEECETLQLTALQANCCARNAGSLCTLCPDGSEGIAFPDRPVPMPSSSSLSSSDTLDGSYVSCADLIQNNETQSHFLAVFADGSPGVCNTTLLRQSAAYCGCPNVESMCDLCEDDDDLLIDEQFDLTNTSCSDIAFQVSLQTEEDQCYQTGLEGFDAVALCCDNVERLAQCTVCSVNEQLIPSRIVTTAMYGDVTCGVVEEAANLATTGAMCRSLLQQVGRRCCLEIPNSDACEIRCPDGSFPTDPFKRDPVTGHTCQSLATEYAKVPGDECAEAATIVGFDAVAFCCPTVQPPNECLLCPPDQTLLYPERVLFAYNEHSCAALAGSIRYVVGRACQNILDETRADRNCQCRPDILPTPAPDPDSIDRESNGQGLSIGLGIFWSTAVLSLLLLFQIDVFV